MFYTQIWQHSAVEALPKVFIWRMCLLSLLCTRLLSVFACLLGCSQLILAVWTVIWLGAVGPTPLSSSPIIDLRGLQALWGHLAPLPAISGWIDSRGHPSAETRGQLQRPPAHFLPPGVPFWMRGILAFHSLHPPLPFCKQVKDMEWVQLLPVISFSLLPSRPHGERGWEISPIQTLHSHKPIWCENLLLIELQT